MIALIFSLAARLWAVLRYAPSNLLIAVLRRRHRLRWGWLTIFAGAAYLAAAFGLTEWIRAGAPEWLYLFVLVAVWSGLKLVAFGPISAILLLAAVVRERRAPAVTSS
jgi:hypothetical protein